MSTRKIVTKCSNARDRASVFWLNKSSTSINCSAAVCHAVHRMWLRNCAKNMMNDRRAAKKRLRWKMKNHRISTMCPFHPRKLINWTKPGKPQHTICNFAWAVRLHPSLSSNFQKHHTEIHRKQRWCDRTKCRIRKLQRFSAKINLPSDSTGFSRRHYGHQSNGE